MNDFEAVPVPLVLHGRSSTGDDKLAAAVKAGISRSACSATYHQRAPRPSGPARSGNGRLGFLPLSMVAGAGVANCEMIAHYITVLVGGRLAGGAVAWATAWGPLAWAA